MRLCDKTCEEIAAMSDKAFACAIGKLSQNELLRLLAKLSRCAGGGEITLPECLKTEPCAPIDFHTYTVVLDSTASGAAVAAISPATPTAGKTFSLPVPYQAYDFAPLPGGRLATVNGMERDANNGVASVNARVHFPNQIKNTTIFEATDGRWELRYVVKA